MARLEVGEEVERSLPDDNRTPYVLPPCTRGLLNISDRPKFPTPWRMSVAFEKAMETQT
ncbi:MAG: hypothetical protein AAGD25_37310 [Cyanobacteria bacterium P01_F01_bin.150]